MTETNNIQDNWVLQRINHNRNQSYTIHAGEVSLNNLSCFFFQLK